MLHDVPPGRTWQATVEDTKCALAWITANAAKYYKISPDRISVMGSSAGGHLALMTAYTAGTGKFPPSCGLPEGKVKSVVDLYGPTDMASFATGPGGTDVGRSILRDTLGGSVTEQEQRYRDWSPNSYLRAGLPPTLILARHQRLPGAPFPVPGTRRRPEPGRRVTPGYLPALHRPRLPHELGSYPAQITRQAVTQFLATTG